MSDKIRYRIRSIFSLSVGCFFPLSWKFLYFFLSRPILKKFFLPIFVPIFVRNRKFTCVSFFLIWFFLIQSTSESFLRNRAWLVYLSPCKSQSVFFPWPPTCMILAKQKELGSEPYLSKASSLALLPPHLRCFPWGIWCHSNPLPCVNNLFSSSGSWGLGIPSDHVQVWFFFFFFFQLLFLILLGT